MTKGVGRRAGGLSEDYSGWTELPVARNIESITDRRLFPGIEATRVRGSLPESHGCSYSSDVVSATGRVFDGVAVEVGFQRSLSATMRRHANNGGQPRLPNSDQCVRQRLSRSLTCANSSSMIAEYPRCAGSRQHYWQHSPAIAGGQADGDWGLPGVDIGVPR